ncbi:ABC transporter ATP-binding protein [Agrococcus baldri]|uniref:ABC transporter ATP-binding protein n=1 Tax=Agrococcus baldri TaxID=153730 RepID=A0AA87URE6_9MICO|nr:ABC transporter ATP-binding protein [Agrococcus baldri]GEK79633.1 ABC transporter ATP-binding protein [Agrococcus baldri]
MNPQVAASKQGRLEAQGMSVTFGGLKAVQNVSLVAEPGQVTAIIGPNGAGKSTFLNLISGFIRPTEGVVYIGGEDISKLRPWTRVRRGMARTFQALEVFGSLTVGENVALGFPAPIGSSPWRPLLQWGGYRKERELIKVETRSLLKRVGLLDRADSLASELSYGDQKLLVVARLLATKADVLMFDEPGAGLPRREINALGSLFRELAAEGKTVVLVDHNMHLIFGYADYVYVLHHGELVADGTPQEIRENEQVVRIYLTGGGEEKAA